MICVDWNDSGDKGVLPGKILSLDVNQNLRVWDFAMSSELDESVSRQLEKLENQLDQRRNLDEQSLSEMH